MNVASRYGDFYYAIRSGYLWLFNEHLSHINPGGHDNKSIITAAEHGRLDMLVLLLQDVRVNPAGRCNAAIRIAAKNGHIEIVNRLLQDPRVNPSVRNSEAIAMAASNGHINVVDRLLQDPRVNPADGNNNIIRWSIEYCEKFVVIDRLLQDPRVYSNLNSNTDICFPHIKMISSRATEVCNALFDLQLPALLTVQILDELFPNCIRMWALWELAATVKHFHERKSAI